MSCFFLIQFNSPGIENLIIKSYMAYAFTLGLERDILLFFAVHPNCSVSRHILIIFKLQICDAVKQFGKVTCYLRQEY